MSGFVGLSPELSHGFEFAVRLEGPWQPLAAPSRHIIELLAPFLGFGHNDDEECQPVLKTAVGVDRWRS
jgi:hypothetical protein